MTLDYSQAEGSTAGQMDIAIQPRPSELPGLRASITEWLRSDHEHLDVVDGAVLAASEMAHLAMEHGADEHPVVLHLRRTHSILVIEVTLQHEGDAQEVLAGLEPATASMEVHIIEHFADRLVTETASGAVTMRSTFHY